MAGDSLLANYQPGEVIHELVIDSRRGGDISLPRWQDHSECKFRVNITCFSLLCPDWCDYSATLLNARKVTFSALSVYSRQLASSHPWWWESAREEQKTFKESYFLCSFQTPACWPPPPHYLHHHSDFSLELALCTRISVVVGCQSSSWKSLAGQINVSHSQTLSLPWENLLLCRKAQHSLKQHLEHTIWFSWQRPFYIQKQASHLC